MRPRTILFINNTITEYKEKRKKMSYALFLQLQLSANIIANTVATKQQKAILTIKVIAIIATSSKSDCYYNYFTH